MQLSREETLRALVAIALADRLKVPLFAQESEGVACALTSALSRFDNSWLEALPERVLIGRAAPAALAASSGEPAPYDHAAQTARSFRLDRITSISPAATPIGPHPPPRVIRLLGALGVTVPSATNPMAALAV